MENNMSEKYDMFFYISTKANTYTPAKTIYVCAPDKDAHSYESVEKFAKDSRWLELAEDDGAVLVMPVAKNGWQALKPTLIEKLYDETRKNFRSKNGDSIPGRNGFVWCWETLIYLVGYGEGAVFAGNVTVTSPNRFAGVALVGGVPCDYTAQSNPSSHWLVHNVSPDYNMRNHDIPVCLWMFGPNENFVKEALAYFSKSNQIAAPAELKEYEGISTKLYKNSREEAAQIRVSVGNFSATQVLAKTIMNQFFNKFILWKNSPDGTLKPYLNKSAFYDSDRYAHDSVMMNDIKYEFSTYLPEGMNYKDAAGLPVVFSVHGRGEPSWIFSTKNAWDRLADETKEFILVLPDSPQNIWLFDRDGEVFQHIIDKLYEIYSIDKSRVYLTGFSNGGMITRQVGNHYPELFAAISPWNAPFADSFEEILTSGYELPCFICAGDNDDKVPLWDDLDSLLENMLKINNCSIREAGIRSPMKFIPDEVHSGENHYTQENKYTDGERFQTFLYNNSYGQARVCFTLMKNMPHGAVYDESRATWAFMKHFSRPKGSKKVVNDEFKS
ncbi:S9 family peptidase [Clostridium estertheticum]|uniref:S9 family peptidase n=1 Tax=Clostridium estertheticum TaxID=238834 RepID=UPI001CF2B91B|nr:S9 family peptidase [Clostridium estertheticum]MCB2358717.1 S9 family peptidase [Clostridium estertheticum]